MLASVNPGFDSQGEHVALSKVQFCPFESCPVALRCVFAIQGASPARAGTPGIVPQGGHALPRRVPLRQVLSSRVGSRQVRASQGVASRHGALRQFDSGGGVVGSSQVRSCHVVSGQVLSGQVKSCCVVLRQRKSRSRTVSESTRARPRGRSPWAECALTGPPVRSRREAAPCGWGR